MLQPDPSRVTCVDLSRGGPDSAGAKLDRYVASLSRDSEFFGLIGRGYPDSLYKVYVRQTRTARVWWLFQKGAGPSRINPIAHQSRLAVEHRVAVIWAPLAYLVNLEHHPDRVSIAKLLARAAELHRTEDDEGPRL